eukprot:gb/GECH01014278.1/.p1 GENE.gb/GECH01014278.1/~~gb/GECH01014278.1/.p1  ORF type:complete len:195 (+),score=45.77 gb/GECH01014278.1/:1-585(+)
MFGILIPGRPVISEMEQVDENKWAIEIPDCKGITEMCVFLLGTEPLPENTGAGVYLSFDTQNWEYVGLVHMGCPSAMMRVPSSFSETPSSPNVSFAGIEAQANSMVVGISIEPPDVLESLEANNPHSLQNMSSEIVTVGKHIATDLFRFMESFAKPTDWGECLVVPTNVLERWMNRFEDKVARDPYFWKQNNTS